ncbi:hypothetical protein AB3480_25470 [Rhizobium mongolense]|uniref:hypothetical protein n=1 Tax=Rhizobium mongolense TaxID=57676 RepID=UPI0034A1BA49
MSELSATRREILSPAVAGGVASLLPGNLHAAKLTMKTASALIHILALSTCFVVQLGAPEGSRMPGVRRAIQTMEDNSAACERRLLTSNSRRATCLQKNT